MTSLRSFSLWVCAVCTAMVGGAGTLAAEDAPPRVDPAAALAPFLPADAFYVGYVDLAAVDPAAIAADIARLAEIPESNWQGWTNRALSARAMLDGVRASGIRTICAVVGLADISIVGGPLVVVTVDQPEKLDSAAAVLLAAIPMFGQPADSPSRLHVERHASGVLLVGTKATLTRYKSLTSVERPDLTQPLTRLAKDGAAAAIVFNADPDFRRVLRELWPPMPDWMSQLKPLTGEFLADRFRYDELAVYTSPQLSIHWAAQMSDPEAAQIGAWVIRGFPDFVRRAAEEEDVPDEVAALAEPLSKLLVPKVEGSRVEIRIDSAGPQLAHLQEAWAPVVRKAFESSRRVERMQALKQLVLAMQWYFDANKQLPASAAIRDADGKPLLSWRVAILPYIEQKRLYDQFHLDEPWDSPHNRKLINMMPAVYADPGHADLTREGKTAYLVPVSPGTVFDAPEGITFRDITDGTAKTIMIVTVAPDRAVAWTKPADWNVDMEHPLEGLKQSGRRDFVAAFCDGHVVAIPTDIDPAKLRAMLTRAGGEQVDGL